MQQRTWLAPTYCPQCGQRQASDARFRPSCGRSFEGTLEAARAAQVPAAEGFRMRNVGMLPSTRYKLIAIWILLLIPGFLYGYAHGEVIGVMVIGFIWFWIVSVPWVIVVWIWASIRQAQLNLEYERWLKDRR